MSIYVLNDQFLHVNLHLTTRAGVINSGHFPFGKSKISGRQS